MKYVKLPSGDIKRVSDNVVIIPPDEANEDYLQYLAWVAEGNVAEDEPAPPTPAIMVVTRAKGKEALVTLGLYEQTKRWVDDYRTPEIVRIGFYDAAEWKIDSPLIALWRDALSQPQSKVQELFAVAANSIL